MAAIKVPTSFNIDVEFEIPEFYRRLAALLIDLLVLYIYNKIASAILDSITGYSSRWTLDTEYNRWGLGLLFILPIILYFPAVEITMNGQSIGKKIMGLRVVNEHGGRPAISQFLIRWLIRDIWFYFLLVFGIYSASDSKSESMIIIISVMGYFIAELVLVISSKKGQRIGDILAHTIVIRTSQKASIEETIFQEVADTYTPVFPQIMQLSDRDINAIKSILESSRKKNDQVMAGVASEKIKAHLKIETSMPAFEFLDVLLKDYNYLSVK